MSPNSNQSAKNSRQYIPPHIEQAMSRHMQQSMPAHLKKYVGAGANTYVPQHAQQQIAQQMQKNMPAHLKQYSGAYMQQRVIEPNTAKLGGSYQAPRTVAPHAPMPDKLRRGHSMYGEQHNVGWAATAAEQATAQPAANTQPGQTYPAPQPPPSPAQPQQPYEFIMNPEPPRRKSFFSGSSLPIKVGVYAGGLLVLLIIYSLLKSVLGGSSALPAYVTVAQDQQELIHLVTNASQQQNLSTSNQNFAATAQLSLVTAQSDLVTYLAKNHKKVNAKQLGLRISAATDQQLSTAALASTYNQTFAEIMQAKLTRYLSDLKMTYQQSKGANGRALISHDYDQAQLLLAQLKSASPGQD